MRVGRTLNPKEKNYSGQTRVEFSITNIEILVTVTNASNIRSIGRLYSHKFSSFSLCFLHCCMGMHILLPRIIFFQFLYPFYHTKKLPKTNKLLLRKTMRNMMMKMMRKMKRKMLLKQLIRVFGFGASIFGQSNGPDISGFWIIIMGQTQDPCLFLLISEKYYLLSCSLKTTLLLA